MKEEILKILQMQAEGRLTQEQAAQLLAMLADGRGASRADGASTVGNGFKAEGGPQVEKERVGGTASATLHGILDSAVSMGVTVGRAASVLGGEIVGMVHREDGGNVITLGKVEMPTGGGGEEFEFRGNTINVSKVSGVVLKGAVMTGNRVNASKLSQVTITKGRMVNCELSGSSVTQVVVEGTDAAESALSGLTFNATKFSRGKVVEGSGLEEMAICGSAVKELALSGGAVVKGGSVSDSVVQKLSVEGGRVEGLSIERATVAGLALRGVSWEGVTIGHTRVEESRVDGGEWRRVKFCRDALGTGSGGRDSLVHEAAFEGCHLEDVSFVGCIFRRATLRGLTLSGMVVRNVDFTGMTIDSEETFRKAAGL